MVLLPIHLSTKSKETRAEFLIDNSTLIIGIQTDLTLSERDAFCSFFTEHLNHLCHCYSISKAKAIFYEFGKDYAYIHDYVIYNNTLRARRLIPLKLSDLLSIHNFLLDSLTNS